MNPFLLQFLQGGGAVPAATAHFKRMPGVGGAPDPAMLAEFLGGGSSVAPPAAVDPSAVPTVTGGAPVTPGVAPSVSARQPGPAEAGGPAVLAEELASPRSITTTPQPQRAGGRNTIPGAAEFGLGAGGGMSRDSLYDAPEMIAPTTAPGMLSPEMGALPAPEPSVRTYDPAAPAGQVGATAAMAGGTDSDALAGGAAMTPQGGNDAYEWVRMANESATRNMPITDTLADKITRSIESVYGPGHYAEVYSGGQPGKGSGKPRVGSVRHDHGRAADVYIYGPDGRRLTGDALAPLAQFWAASKFGGVGLEMRGGGIHLDEHETPPPGGGMQWFYSEPTAAQRAAIEAGLRGELPEGVQAIADELIGGANNDDLSAGGAIVGGDVPPAGAPMDIRQPAQRPEQMQEAGDQLASALEQAAPAGPIGAGPTGMRPGIPQGALAGPRSILASGAGRVANFFGGQPDGTTPAQNIAAGRQRAREANARAARINNGTIPGGLGYVVEGLGGSIRDLRADRAASARQQALADALTAEGGVDVNALAQVDPGAAFGLIQQREQQAARERLLAQQQAAEQGIWEDVRTLEDGRVVQRNRRTGQLKVSGAAATNVNVNTADQQATREDSLREEMTGAIGKHYADTYEQGQNAVETLSRVGMLEQLLEETPGGFINAVVSLASDYSLQVADFQGELEAAKAIISQMVPAQRPAGSGTMSNADLDLYKLSLPRLINTPEGNAMIIEGIRAINEYYVAQADLIHEFYSGRITQDELRDLQRSMQNPLEGWQEAMEKEGFVPRGNDR